nr:hypothetical protein [Micromonospora sp. DSM 115978]
MAPEQFDGTHVSPATDLYALGVLLYERLAGRPMFDPQLSATALMRHHLDVTPPPLDEVPRPLADLVMWTLEKDPASRPQAALPFAVELAEVASNVLGGGWLTRSGVRTHLADEVREAVDGSPSDVPLAPTSTAAGVERRPATTTTTTTWNATTNTATNALDDLGLPDNHRPGIPTQGRSRRRHRGVVAAGATAIAAVLVAVTSVLLATNGDDGPGATAPSGPPPPATATASAEPPVANLNAAAGPVIDLRI